MWISLKSSLIRVEQVLGPLTAGGAPIRWPGARPDEQLLHVERAVGLADDLAAGTPEAGPGDAGVMRPVDIDTDQIHALDAERGAVRARDADLDARLSRAPVEASRSWPSVHATRRLSPLKRPRTRAGPGMYA